MSSLRLELIQNAVTGRHDLFVKLDSDRDLTSHEHEALHRSLVEKLLGQGLLGIEDIGDLKVERVRPLSPDASPGLTEPSPRSPSPNHLAH